MSIPLCQAVPLQSQLTSEPTSKAACGTGTCTLEHRSTVYVKHCQASQAHCCSPAGSKKTLMDREGEQDAEYIVPLVTTEISSFRGYRQSNRFKR